MVISICPICGGVHKNKREASQCKEIINSQKRAKTTSKLEGLKEAIEKKLIDFNVYYGNLPE